MDSNIYFLYYQLGMAGVEKEYPSCIRSRGIKELNTWEFCGDEWSYGCRQSTRCASVTIALVELVQFHQIDLKRLSRCNVML